MVPGTEYALNKLELLCLKTEDYYRRYLGGSERRSGQPRIPTDLPREGGAAPPVFPASLGETLRALPPPPGPGQGRGGGGAGATHF